MATALLKNENVGNGNVTDKPKSKRILELDAIRALAAINLLLFHFTWVYHAKYGFDSPLGMMFPYGKYGVQMFFMLSGFVNAFTLMKKNPTSKDFVVGRAIRIVPTFWLLVAFNVVLLSLVPMFGLNVTSGSIAANMTVMPQMFGFECMEPVTWTLMIEVLFYGFLLFALVTGRLNRPLFGIMMVTMAICFVGVLCNQYIQQHYPATTLADGSKFVEDLFIMKWMPLFSMGILLNEIKMKRGHIALNCFGIFVSAVVFHVIDIKDHNPKATALMFMMLAACAYGRLPILRFKPLLFIGSISYPLYLFHNNAGTLLMCNLEEWGVHPYAAFALTTGAVVAASAALTFWFERPITKFLRTAWRVHKERPASENSGDGQTNSQMQTASTQ